MGLHSWILLATFVSVVSCTPELFNEVSTQAPSNPVCRLIDRDFYPWAFPYNGAYMCYYFINPSRFVGKRVRIKYINITNPITNTSNIVPFYRSPNEILIPFNYTDARIEEAIRLTLKSDMDVVKWKKCSEKAIECCDAMQNVSRIEGHCPPTWDSWYCWLNGSPPSTFQKGTCPDYIYTGVPPSCTHFHTKECFNNGTWRQKTDYSTCTVTPEIYSRTVYHVILLSLSLAASIPALIIFFSYRKLRIMRVALHRTLIMAIATRNILTIISKTTIVLPELSSDTKGVMAENGVPCRILASLERLSANIVFACMLLEGIYLHRLIAAAFRGEPKMNPIIVGAGVLACIPAFCWCVVMAVLHDSDCWYVDADGTGYQWINDGPRLAMIIVNTLLLIDIVRVLVTKLRSVNSASIGKLRRTAKATVFLMPLFGVQLLVTMVRPNTTDCIAEQVYFFFAYAMDGLQGLLVTLLYCYCNNEVLELLSRSMRDFATRKGLPCFNMDDMSGRRATLVTTLSPPTLITDGSLKSASFSHVMPTAPTENGER